MTTFYTILLGIIIYCVCLFFVNGISNINNNLQQKIYLRGNAKLSQECAKLIDSLSQSKISILSNTDKKMVYVVDNIVGDLADLHRMSKSDVRKCIGI